MSPGGVLTEPAPKRRRRRPAVSCELCRSRKVRCDKELPCGTCIRTRNSSLCIYRDDIVGADETPDQADRSRPLATDRRPTPPGNGSATIPIPVRQPRVTYTETRQQAVHQLPQHLPTATSAPSLAVAPVLPKIRDGSNKTKLFGQTHWVHLAERFPVSGKIDPVEIEPSFVYYRKELGDIVKEARNLRSAVRVQNSVKLDQPISDLFSTLPSKSVCEALARCYFRTFEPIHRVLHVPSFWKDFDLVWEQDNSGQAASRFLMKLVLVLAIGTTFHVPLDDDEKNSLHRLAQIWIQSVQWMLMGPQEKVANTLDGLQICCLLLLARQTTFNCDGPSAFVSPGSILKMAMTMGLHRNPGMFSTLSPYQREIRCRLWATVLELTSQCCLTQALPLGCTQADYDTPLPSNLNDIDLKPEAKTLPPVAEGVTESSLQILLAKTLPCRLRILQILNDFRSHHEYDTTLKLGAELRVACREIAGFFNQHVHPEQPSDGRSHLNLTDFHRRLLDMHIRRFILFLHRPFMVQARSNPQFYLARKVCVESAMVYLANANATDLHLPFEKFDDLARMSTVGRGFYKGAYSSDAIMILSFEIVTQLQDESGPPQGGLDPLDEMARAGRAPLIDTLQRLEPQLLQMIRIGGTSLGRYLFVTAYLSQIRAMEAGRPVRQALFEPIFEALKRCCASLRERKVVGATPTASEFTTDDGFPSDIFPFDAGFMDLTNFDWSNPSSVFFPPLSEALPMESQPVV